MSQLDTGSQADTPPSEQPQEQQHVVPTWAIVLYEAAWLLALGIAFYHRRAVSVWFSGVLAGDSPALTPERLCVLWNTMACGGLGGEMGAYWGLLKHRTRGTEPDNRDRLGYLVYPPVAILLGTVAYALVGSGFIDLEGESLAATSISLNALFAYLFAWLVGFQLERIAHLLLGGIKSLVGSGQHE
jgi:hypothetical protein